MRVKQLVGAYAGQIVDMPFHVAKRCIANGTAEPPEGVIKGDLSPVTKAEPVVKSAVPRAVIGLPKAPAPLPETTPIMFRVSGGGTEVVGSWPQFTTFTPEVVARSTFSRIDGDSVVIDVLNGAAIYDKIGIGQDGRWVCALRPPHAEVKSAEPEKRKRGRPRKAPARVAA